MSKHTPPDGTPPVLLTMTMEDWSGKTGGTSWNQLSAEVCALSAALAEARQKIARLDRHGADAVEVLKDLETWLVQEEARGRTVIREVLERMRLLARAREGR